MTRAEFDMIWHDWLRGVSLIGLVGLLVALHFLKLFSPQDFAMLVVLVGLLGGTAMAGSVCLSGLAPLPVRILAPLVALVAAGLFAQGTRQVIYLAEPYAQATISGTAPKATLEVPTDGLEESYLQVRGRPGASPSGKDNEVTARLALRGPGWERSLRFELFKNKTAKGQKGSASLGLRDADAALLTGLQVGVTEITLTELKPEVALPLELSLHWPLVPPSVLRSGLMAMAVMALLLAGFSARRNQFPFPLPFTLVLVLAYWFIAQGIPPRQPLLTLLGIGIGSAIAGSGVGYGAGKLLVLLLRPKHE